MIAVTVALTPESEALLRDAVATLRDIRNLLSRIAWNQAARAESDAGDATAHASAPTRGDLGAPASDGEATPRLADPIAPAHVPPVPDAAPPCRTPAQAAPAADSQAAVPTSVSSQTARPADAATRPAAAFDEWTEEQEREARRLVAACAPWSEVFAAVNGVAGKRFSQKDSLQEFLRKRGITRVLARAPHAADAPRDDGRVEVVRNTARPAVVLTGARPAPPPPAPGVKLPAHMVERDGAPSVARKQMADDAAAESAVPMTLADALEWGARNGVAPLPAERPMQTFGRVNSRRRAEGLPPYTLIAPRGPRDTLAPPRVGGARDAAA